MSERTIARREKRKERVDKIRATEGEEAAARANASKNERRMRQREAQKARQEQEAAAGNEERQEEARQPSGDRPADAASSSEVPPHIAQAPWRTAATAPSETPEPPPQPQEEEQQPGAPEDPTLETVASALPSPPNWSPVSSLERSPTPDFQWRTPLPSTSVAEKNLSRKHPDRPWRTEANKTRVSVITWGRRYYGDWPFELRTIENDLVVIDVRRLYREADHRAHHLSKADGCNDKLMLELTNREDFPKIVRFAEKTIEPRIFFKKRDLYIGVRCNGGKQRSVGFARMLHHCLSLDPRCALTPKIQHLNKERFCGCWECTNRTPEAYDEAIRRFTLEYMRE